MKTIRSILHLTLIISGLLTGCSVLENKSENEIIFEPQGTESVSLIVDGRLVPKKTTEVVSYIGEQIDELLVEEGQVVNQGDLILKMKGIEVLQAKISSAELEILLAKKNCFG